MIDTAIADVSKQDAPFSLVPMEAIALKSTFGRKKLWQQQMRKRQVRIDAHTRGEKHPKPRSELNT